MTPAVMRYDAIAVLEEKHHLGVQSSADNGQPWLNTMG